MFCKNCGTELDEGAVFCGNCGTPVEKDEQATPANEEAATAKEEATTVNDEAATVTEEVTTPESQPTTTEAPKKTKKKGKLLKAIIAVVLIVAIALTTLFVGFKSQAMELIMSLSSPEKHQQYVYSNLAETLTENYGESVAPVASEAAKGSGASGEISFTIGEGASSALSSLGIDLGSIENIKLTYDMNMVDNLYGMDFALICDETELLSGEMVLDFEKGMSLYIPVLSEEAVFYEFDEEMIAEMEPAFKSTEVMYEIIPDTKLVEKVVPAYVEELLKELDGVKRAKETITAGGVEKKVNCFTVEVTEEMLMNTTLNLLNRVKEDKDIEEFIKSAAESIAVIGELEGSADELYGEFTDAIDELIEELNETEVSTDVIFTLKTWSDNKSQVLGVKMFNEEFSAFIGCVEDGKDVGCELNITIDGETLLLTYTGTEEKNLANGELELSFDGENILTFKCEDIKTDIDGFDGKMTLSFGSGVEADAEAAAVLGMMSITMEGEAAENSQSITIGIGVMGSDFLSATVKGEAHEAVKPELHKDAKDVNEWAMSITTDEIMDRLDKTGLMSIVENLMGLAYGGGLDNSYEDDYDYDIEGDDDYSDYDYGWEAGYADGYDDAVNYEYKEYYGYSAEDDASDEYMEGYDEGYEFGFEEGATYADMSDYDRGYEDGNIDGYYDGSFATYQDGYGDCAEEDASDEYMEGYDQGYEDGFEEGQADADETSELYSDVDMPEGWT